MIKGNCMISKIIVPSDGSKTAKKAAPKMPDSAKARKAKPAKTAARTGQKKRK